MHIREIMASAELPLITLYNNVIGLLFIASELFTWILKLRWYIWFFESGDLEKITKLETKI